MLYKQPFVLYLNIIVSIILFLLLLPTLFNSREKLGIKITLSLIYFTVIETCFFNMMVLYFNIADWIFISFAMMSLPFAFGPAIYYYARFVNGNYTIKNLFFHLLISLVIFVSGISLHFIYTDKADKDEVLNLVKTGTSQVYNVINYFTVISPIIYTIAAKKWIKKLKIDPNDPLFKLRILRKRWSMEFCNYFLFNMVAFTIITLFVNLVLGYPQIYSDLIGMPAFMGVVYILVSVRNTIINNEAAVLYAVAKTENEHRLAEQRISISRDLHDNIGSQLTLINSSLETIKYKMENDKGVSKENISNVSGMAAEAISELRDTIWAMSSDAIKFEDVEARIKNFISNAKSSTEKIDFEINFDESLSAKMLSSKQAMNIYRVIQEATNNAIKHSDCNQIKIKVSNEFQNIILSVKDYGKGFNPAESKGNGIKNMKHRILEFGGDFNILSSEKGTEIIAKIPENM